jgi:hypothetical protein
VEDSFGVDREIPIQSSVVDLVFGEEQMIKEGRTPKRPWKQISKSAEAYEKGRQLLDGIDNYLEQNIKKLTIHDIHDIYAGLSVSQQPYRGTAGGFTGFSEFLIFRCLIHTLAQIGVKLRPNPDGRTTSFTDGHGLIVTQGILPQGSQEKMRPDILIQQKLKIVAAAEIKIVLTNSKEVTNHAVKRLEHYYANNPGDFYGVLFIFLVNEPVREYLREVQDGKKEWLEIITLNGKNEKFMPLLEKSLDLCRFRP